MESVDLIVTCRFSVLHPPWQMQPHRNRRRQILPVDGKGRFLWMIYIVIDSEHVFFCFYSVICNPLHAARRAIAAAVPLPLAGQQRAFIKKPSPTPNQLARLE